MKRLVVKQASGLKMDDAAHKKEFAGVRSLGKLIYPMDDRIQHENR